MVAAFQFCSATLVMCGWYYYAVWARARTRAMPEYPCVPLGECHRGLFRKDWIIRDSQMESMKGNPFARASFLEVRQSTCGSSFKRGVSADTGALGEIKRDHARGVAF
jgi:hypothetical protein